MEENWLGCSGTTKGLKSVTSLNASVDILSEGSLIFAHSTERVWSKKEALAHKSAPSRLTENCSIGMQNLYLGRRLGGQLNKNKTRSTEVEVRFLCLNTLYQLWSMMGVIVTGSFTDTKLLTWALSYLIFVKEVGYLNLNQESNILKYRLYYVVI